MRTPYIHQLFGPEVEAKLKAKRGWLTAGVASSIPWPQENVWVYYDRYEYILRGSKDGEQARPPCISTPAPKDEISAATTRLYKFASVLGWFKGGYVDLTGSAWSTSPILYGSRDTFTSALDGGKYFRCNYMPVIEDDQVRKALAFMREGRRLRHVHEPYAFLSFYKVVESQLTSKDRVAWIQANLDLLEGDAIRRIAKLRAQGVDVGMHLYESGRCAVAHASLGGGIVDPDIPADRRRIAEDLEVMAALAERYLKVEVGVPDEMAVYESRSFLDPWYKLLPEETLRRLHGGEEVRDLGDYGRLRQNTASVRLWPHEAPEPMRGMTLIAEGYGPGLVTFLAHNQRRTVFLRFALDIAEGRLHTMLEDGGLTEQFNELTESELEHYTRYFHSVVGNALVEVCIDGVDPVPCEVVIPVNIIPQAPEEMVGKALASFRAKKSTDDPYLA